MRSDMDRVLVGRHSRRGPAYRFLRSRVGRPWNAVFSEICTGCRGRRNQREEFLRLVARCVERIDGELVGVGHWLSKRVALGSGELYVCPDTGLLRVVPEVSRRRRPKATPRFIRIDTLHQCHFLEGGWHLVTLQRLPPDPRKSRGLDVVLNRPICELTAEMVERNYGDKVFAVAKRRMTERQLEQYKISPSP